MQFLRTLFWVVVAIIAVIFATKNWTTTQVNLWGGIVADVKLPVLLMIAFLTGLIPPALLYQAYRWRMRRRLDGAERTIAELRPIHSALADPVAPYTPPTPEPPMISTYTPPAPGVDPV